MKRYTVDDFERDWASQTHDGNYGYPEVALANGCVQWMDIEEIIRKHFPTDVSAWGNGYKTVFREIVQWCVDNCKGAWVVSWNAELAYFENKDDEILFRLRWV